MSLSQPLQLWLPRQFGTNPRANSASCCSGAIEASNASRKPVELVSPACGECVFAATEWHEADPCRRPESWMLLTDPFLSLLNHLLKTSLLLPKLLLTLRPEETTQSLRTPTTRWFLSFGKIEGPYYSPSLLCSRCDLVSSGNAEK